MFVIDIPFLDLNQIYNSGQCFRWIKLKDDMYVVPFKNQAIKVMQQKERILFSCTDQQFYDVWFNYFDVQKDYLASNSSIKKLDDYLKVCANRAKGVRIIKQDLFEMIITFALATATNIPRIKSMVNALCELCGVMHKQSMREAGKVTWYEFPTAQDIISKKDELFKCKLGYREEIIIQLCQDVVDGWLDLDELASMEYKEAKEYLMQFNGIGPKVADCICLYGLHILESFPVDTHIEQILEREFDCDLETFDEWYLEDLQNERGLVQQYMFYNELNPPEEVKQWV